MNFYLWPTVELSHVYAGCSFVVCRLMGYLSMRNSNHSSPLMGRFIQVKLKVITKCYKASQTVEKSFHVQ